MVNPFRGLPLSDSLTGGRRRREEKGFLVLLPRPEARADEPRATLRFFPRIVRGQRESRRHADIELLVADRPYARTPYYAELDSRPVEGSEPYETIRLYVDRSVTVRFPEATVRLTPREPWRTVFRIDFPPDHQVPITQHVFVVIHRTQRASAVPQSPDDAAGVFSPPLRYLGSADAATVTSSRYEPVVRTRSSHPFAAWETTANGGCRIVLGRETRTTEGSMMGAATRARSREVLATLVVQYFNPEYRGSYHVSATQNGDAISVTLMMSRNVYATMWVVGANADLVDRLLARDHLERARVELAESGVELQLITGTDAVPRPSQRLRSTAEAVPWYESEALERQLYVRGARDHDAESAFAWFDASAGLVPIIGDLYDVGHLAYAIATGEDFSGAPVDGFSLLLMGLAALPLVPGAVRRVEGLADGVANARRALAGSGLAEGLRDSILARRPALAHLGERIADTETAMHVSRAVVSHAEVSDPAVAAAVRRAGGAV